MSLIMLVRFAFDDGAKEKGLDIENESFGNPKTRHDGKVCVFKVHSENPQALQGWCNAPIYR